MITSSTKIVGAVALVAALLGGSIRGALVKSSNTSEPTEAASTTTTTTAPSQSLTGDAAESSTATTGTEQATLDATGTGDAAYRDGFEEGFRIAREGSERRPRLVLLRLAVRQQGRASSTAMLLRVPLRRTVRARLTMITASRVVDVLSGRSTAIS